MKLVIGDVEIPITKAAIDAFREAMNGPVPESRFLASYNVPDYRIREGLRAAFGTVEEVHIK